MTRNSAHTVEGDPVDLDTEEQREASHDLREGRVARIALAGGRIALCESPAEVQAAQRGKIPHSAVRLDRGRT